MAFAAASSQLATFPAIFGSAPAAFTIESWVKFPTATGNYGVGYDGRSVGGAGPLLYMIETSGFAAIFNDALQTSGNSNIGNNAWHCLQARLSGTNLSILVDGNLFGGTGAQGTTPWSAGHLGVSFPTPAAYFNGSNQELRISNIARSNAWLSTTYNNQSLPTSGAGFYTVA
jgi:hypothetical protein